MKPVAFAAVLCASAYAIPCCGIAEKGTNVRFIGQTNIVVWDAEKKLEHFIRNATFSTTGKGLGFIAPTPTQPELSEADSYAFSLLASLEPKKPELTKDTEDAAAAPASASSVAVVHEQDVAGYHAAVLKATDTAGLTDWLKKNGYPAPKFLDGWVKPYLEKGWYLTAFKVKGGDRTETGPVRMSFKAERAFNPYSVPEENGGGGANLRLYYVSAGHETPRIGGSEGWKSSSWSAPLNDENRTQLAGYLKLPANAIPEGASVTTYEDSDFGRPGLDDLYFVSNDGRAGLAVVGGAVALLAVAAARRRGRLQATSA